MASISSWSGRQSMASSGPNCRTLSLERRYSHYGSAKASYLSKMCDEKESIGHWSQTGHLVPTLRDCVKYRTADKRFLPLLWLCPQKKRGKRVMWARQGRLQKNERKKRLGAKSNFKSNCDIRAFCIRPKKFYRHSFDLHAMIDLISSMSSAFAFWHFSKIKDQNGSLRCTWISSG